MCLRQFFARHLKEMQLLAPRRRADVVGDAQIILQGIPRIEVRACLPRKRLRPFLIRRHYLLEDGASGRGIATPMLQPWGRCNSWRLIFSHSSGVTSTITDGYGIPLA